MVVRSVQCTVTGLTDGDAYTFTVTAQNAAGNGSPSGSSNSVTPVGVPGAPSGIVVIGKPASIVVSWAAPSDNGSTITGYTATALLGNIAGTSCTSDALTCTITGLVDGDAYTVSVLRQMLRGARLQASPGPSHRRRLLELR